LVTNLYIPSQTNSSLAVRSRPRPSSSGEGFVVSFSFISSGVSPPFFFSLLSVYQSISGLRRQPLLAPLILSLSGDIYYITLSFLNPSPSSTSSPAGPASASLALSPHHPPCLSPRLFILTMAAVNMQMMSTNMPLDFLPLHAHSRSNSVSSSSTHSSNSRPHSAHGSRLPPGMGPSAEDLYRASYHLGHQTNQLANDHHVRFSIHPSNPRFALITFTINPVSIHSHLPITTSLIPRSRAISVPATSALVPLPRPTLEIPTASIHHRAKPMTSRCSSEARYPIMRCMGVRSSLLRPRRCMLQEHSGGCRSVLITHWRSWLPTYVQRQRRALRTGPSKFSCKRGMLCSTKHDFYRPSERIFFLFFFLQACRQLCAIP
jgi:hypothetical protein